METLETTRLTIRPWSMEDLAEAHRLLDLDIQWAGPGFPLERRREKLQLNVSLARWEDTGKVYGSRALVLHSTGEIIGIVGLHPDLWPPDWKRAFWPALLGLPADDPALAHASLELGIGYALSHRHRRQGYAAEAVRAVLGHAWGALQVGRVFALTDKHNAGSVGVMRRVGMRTSPHPDASVLYPGTAGVIEHPGPDA